MFEFEFNPKQTMQIMLILRANAPFLNSHFFQTLTSQEVSSPLGILQIGPSSHAPHILITCIVSL